MGLEYIFELPRNVEGIKTVMDVMRQRFGNQFHVSEALRARTPTPQPICQTKSLMVFFSRK